MFVVEPASAKPYSSPLTSSILQRCAALEPEAQWILCQSWVFPASFDKTAGAAIFTDCWGTSYHQTPHLLSKLLKVCWQQKLLARESGTKRYYLPPEVQALIQAYLDLALKETLRLRHATYYLAVAQRAAQLYQRGKASADQGLQLFDQERANIDAGWQWAHQHQPSPATDDLLYGFAAATAALGQLRYDPANERIPQYALVSQIAHQQQAELATLMALSSLSRAYVASFQLPAAIATQEETLALLAQMIADHYRRWAFVYQLQKWLKSFYQTLKRTESWLEQYYWLLLNIALQFYQKYIHTQIPHWNKRIRRRISAKPKHNLHKKPIMFLWGFLLILSLADLLVFRPCAILPSACTKEVDVNKFPSGKPTREKDIKQVGLFIYVFLLMGMNVYATGENFHAKRQLMLALLLLPLSRILPLPFDDIFLALDSFQENFPDLIRFQNLIYQVWLPWSPLVSLPLIYATWKTRKVVNLSWKKLGLHSNNLTQQLVLVCSGITFGSLEFLLSFQLHEAVTGKETYNTPAFLGVSGLLFLTGVMEELIFRGLIQALMLPMIGRWAIVYVALISAAMRMGYLSLREVAVVFVFSLLASSMVYESRSLVGVALAHGLANMVLFILLSIAH